MKKRVTGLGGFFFKTKNPDKIKKWYGKHLGLPVDDYGCTFWWKDKQGKDCSTQWSPFKEDTKYFSPSEKQFIVTLKKEGVTIVGEIEKYDYGKFGWILDPEGNKIELWEPVDSAFL